MHISPIDSNHVNVLQKRNIRCDKRKDDDDDDDSDSDNDDAESIMLRKKLSELDLGPYHPSGARVQLEEHGKLYWPVLFYYPEYKQTDFIAAFCEDHW